jgi:phosphoribosylformimino-5-aminoimidazole carboxamide ribotide isomerase
MLIDSITLRIWKEIKYMLIPSIDLMGGRVVQLVQGEDLAVEFDDLEYWIERFSAYPLVQLIDLDAAKRQGDNRRLVEAIVRRLPCQIGGGIRNVEDAVAVLDAGAKRVIVGSSLFESEEHFNSSSAVPPPYPVRCDFAEELANAVGEQQLVFCVDSRNDHVAVRGWRENIQLRPEDAMRALESFCGAFLYTHVDTEGTMSGFPIDIARRLRQETARQLIVAGGIRDQNEVDALHAFDVDAVAGMAIYTGAMHA